jgi:hypothetical protein
MKGVIVQILAGAVLLTGFVMAYISVVIGKNDRRR